MTKGFNLLKSKAAQMALSPFGIGRNLTLDVIENANTQNFLPPRLLQGYRKTDKAGAGTHQVYL